MVLITADLENLRRVFEKGLEAYLRSPVEQAAGERYLERVIA